MQKIHVFINGDSDRYALREMGERQLDFGYILQVGWLTGEKEGIKEGRQVKAWATQAADGEVFRSPDEPNHLTGIP